MFGQFGNAMDVIKRLQQNVASMDEKLQGELIEIAGSDVLTVTINGQQQIMSIELNPKYLTPESAVLLQDLLITTLNNAYLKSKELHKSAMDELAGELNLPKIPGLF